MWKPWGLVRASNEGAVRNARSAATALGRQRVERLEIEQYVAPANDERRVRWAALPERRPAPVTRGAVSAPLPCRP